MAFPSRRNALVCSHDHLTLFLTLVAGLEFIRFDLDLVSRLGLLAAAGFPLLPHPGMGHLPRLDFPVTYKGGPFPKPKGFFSTDGPNP